VFTLGTLLYISEKARDPRQNRIKWNNRIAIAEFFPSVSARIPSEFAKHSFANRGQPNVDEFTEREFPAISKASRFWLR